MEKIYFLKRKEEEIIQSYIVKFETTESDLRSSGVELSSLNLAIHLLETINVDENQRRSIVSQVKFEDNSSVYDDITKAIRLLEGCLA